MMQLKNKSGFINGLLLFTIIFALYALTAPRTVVLEDDGIFILASYFNGIAHSPGYPLFTLLGYIVSHIPIASVAYRVHLLSALFGAMSCVCLYFIVLHFLSSRLYGVIAALSLGVSKTFWSQAIIAEVYTLNMFIFLVLFYLALYQSRGNGVFSKRLFYFMIFVYGLGLSNHWPLLILSTPTIVALLWPVRKYVIRNLILGIPFFALGLLPYLWMVIRSQMDPVISFYGPIDSLSDFWYMVSREGYMDTDKNVGAGFYDKIEFCLFALKQTILQLGPVATVFAVIGVFVQFWKWERFVSLGLLLAYFNSSILLALLLGFNYDLLHQNIFMVYPLIPYMVFILWCVLGIKVSVEYINNTWTKTFQSLPLEHVFSLLVLGTGFAANLPVNSRSSDKLGESYALSVLYTLEKDAIYFVGGDVDAGTIGYFNLVEKVRPDVSLYNARSLIFNTRLEDAINYDVSSNYETLSSFIRQQDRPIYFIADIPKLYGVDDFGLYRRVGKSLKVDATSIELHPVIKDYFESLLANERMYDPWEKMMQRAYISDYCRIVTLLYISGKQMGDLNELERVCQGYYGLITAAQLLLEHNRADTAYIKRLIEKAKPLTHEAINKEAQSVYNFVMGRVFEKQLNFEKALSHYEESIKIWPDSKNAAYKSYGDIQKIMQGKISE